MIVNPVRYGTGGYQIDKPVSFTIKNSTSVTIGMEIRDSPTSFAARFSLGAGQMTTRPALSLRSIVITGLPSSSVAKVLAGTVETSRNYSVRFLIPMTDCSVEIATS